jgi:hypothetical protein
LDEEDSYELTKKMKEMKAGNFPRVEFKVS